MKEGDYIKLGRVRFRIREIKTDKNEVPIENNENYVI